MHTFKYITVADLSVLLLMTFSTIVTVFTVMIYVLLYYHDMVNFNYHPALMHTSTHTHMYIHMDTHTCTAHIHTHTHKLEKVLYCLQLDVICNYIHIQGFLQIDIQ